MASRSYKCEYEFVLVPWTNPSGSETYDRYEPLPLTANSFAMDEVRAATTIQAYVRGFLARKLYAQELLKVIEREEAEMKERQQQQLVEGELLIERYRLQQDVADCHTLTSNHTRRLNTMATRIQRAWRRRQQGRQQTYSSDHPSYTDATLGSGCGSLSPSTAPNESDHSSESLDDLARQVHTVFPFGNHDDGDDIDDMFEYPEGFSVMSSRTDYLSTSVKYGHLAKGHYLTALHRNMPQSGQLPTFSKPSSVQFKNGYNSPPRRTFSEDRYRLLHSIELSDSSGDEDVTLMEHNGLHGAPSDEWWTIPDPENEHLAEQVPMGLASSQVRWNKPDPENDQLTEQAPVGLASNPLMWNKPDPKKPAADEIPTSTGPTDQHMKFLEEANGPHRKQEIPIQTEASHKLMDHSVNPLHKLNVQQLRQLSLSLEQKVLALSTSLVQLLEERDALTAEGELLRTNIANLARRAQDLYPRP